MLYICPVLFLFVITMIFHKSTGLPQCTQPIKDRGLTQMEKDNILQLTIESHPSVEKDRGCLRDSEDSPSKRFEESCQSVLSCGLASTWPP